MKRRRKKRSTIWKKLLWIGLIIIAIEVIMVMTTGESNVFNQIVKTIENIMNTDHASNQSKDKTKKEGLTNSHMKSDAKIIEKEVTDKESKDSDEESSLRTSDGGDTESYIDTRSEDIRAQEILDQMDLHQKISQMFIVFVDSLTGVSNTTVAGSITQKALEKYPVGGVLYQKGNLSSEQQVTEMIQGIQSYSEIPLFIASDEEGGRVARVMETLHPYSLEGMLHYKDMGKDQAYKNAATIAHSIGKYGFNTDFAPVADVWSNPVNTVIGDRAYSDDFEQGAELIPAAVQGFKDEGMICSLKHFPGHGDTKVDSHYGAAYVTKSLDELRKDEFLPFIAGIDAGADMVMIGHLIVRDIDDVPATFSHKIVTDILRDELSFKGVIVTDALNMQAMTDYYGSTYIPIHAVKAGADILLCPSNLEESIEALVDAVEKGDILEDRIDESVKRILKLKLQKGIIK